MGDFDVTSNRVVIVEPGDVLVVGHAPDMPAEWIDKLRRALNLTAVIALPGPVDLGVIKTGGDGQEVHVVVSPPTAQAMGEEVARVVRRFGRGR